jgi:hypothetical protein
MQKTGGAFRTALATPRALANQGPASLGPAHFNDEGTLYTSFGFRAQIMINREDFGMVWNTEMEHGGVMVGKHVYIRLDSEADLVEE